MRWCTTTWVVAAAVLPCDGQRENNVRAEGGMDGGVGVRVDWSEINTLLQPTSSATRAIHIGLVIIENAVGSVGDMHGRSVGRTSLMRTSLLHVRLQRQPYSIAARHLS